jgi:chaperonin GroES
MRAEWPGGRVPFVVATGGLAVVSSRTARRSTAWSRPDADWAAARLRAAGVGGRGLLRLSAGLRPSGQPPSRSPGVVKRSLFFNGYEGCAALTPGPSGVYHSASLALIAERVLTRGAPLVACIQSLNPVDGASYAMATNNAGKVAPLSDRVVVKATEETETMRGGLYIPDTAKEKPQQGEVIAVGPGRTEDGKRVPMEVKAGDKVLYGKYSGTEVTIEGEQLLILRESDILAIVNN